jgi:hypothetical protein
MRFLGNGLVFLPTRGGFMNYWTGPVPEKDDFGVPIRTVFVDGKTLAGPWAIMAPESWMRYAMPFKLGIGFGQMYEKQSDGRFMKTAG